MQRKRPNRKVIAISAIVLIVVVVGVVIAGGRVKIPGSAVPLGHDFPMIHTGDLVAETGPQVNHPAWQPISISTASCTDWTLYHSDQNGPWNIYRLGDVSGKPDAKSDISNGNGADVVDKSPSRSPDGQWAAFVSNRDGNWEIYVASIDGTQQRRVTYNNTAADLSPMWSPDGKAIVYETTRHGSRDLYIIDVTTGEEKRLTKAPGLEVNPFWSPDGKTIVYQSDNDGLWQIVQLDVATLKETKLSDGSSNDINPQFSGDGKMIAFRSFRDTNSNNGVVYIMPATGGSAKAITDAKGNAANQVWSADNHMLAYQYEIDGKSDIYVYDVTSNTTRKVTDGKGKNFAPTWRCDSPTLIYTSDETGDTNLFETSALPITAGPAKVEEVKQLTTDKAADQFPLNSPSVEDGSQRGSVGVPGN